MKPFELIYLVQEPFSNPLYGFVRKRLLQLTRSKAGAAEVLDVGGRKSNYTVGVPGKITISDLPRESDIQKQLNLGINDAIVAEVCKRRSNVRTVLFDDMTKSNLSDSSFDCIVAVEVLEHVEEDAQFVKEVYRVLKPGGAFLMTTPNGDAYPVVNNPDHRRHYKRQQLHDLLSGSFEEVQVEYALRSGKFRARGSKRWTIKRPIQTIVSMGANFINKLESSKEDVKNRPIGTKHLLAVARKAG